MKYLYSWMFVDVVYRHNCRILNVALLEPPGPGVRGSKHMVPRSRQELNITQSGHPHYASEDFGRQDHFIIRTFTGTGGSQYCSAKMHESRGGQRTLATTGSPAGGLVMPFFHHFSCRKWWISWWKLMFFFGDTLLITHYHPWTHPEDIWYHLGIQDTASAAAQRERESLDELRGYKDQLEVGSEAVSIVEPQKRAPQYFGTFFAGMKS